jgi:hypothetical protein
MSKYKPFVECKSCSERKYAKCTEKGRSNMVAIMCTCKNYEDVTGEYRSVTNRLISNGKKYLLNQIEIPVIMRITYFRGMLL